MTRIRVRFDFNDIVKYFSDIWYPSVDDIIIFDDSYKVCMMIRHDGVIYLLNKKTSEIRNKYNVLGIDSSLLSCNKLFS